MGRILRNKRGSLTAEMAVVAGTCVVVIIAMTNICLYLIRVAQFDRISAEVARSCAYANSPLSPQEGIVQAMGLAQGDGRFGIRATESGGGGICGTKTIRFELTYQPFVSEIGVGALSVRTPVFTRTKTYAVPCIGYEGR